MRDGKAQQHGQSPVPRNVQRIFLSVEIATPLTRSLITGKASATAKTAS